MAMRRSHVQAILLASMLSVLATPALAFKPSMRLTGVTAPPIGHVQFCENYPGDCLAFDRPDQVVRLTPATLDQLDRLNRAVNAAVIPATDLEVFGIEEKWEYPALVGDCEDYALEKRRELIGSGWPASALLITVVRDEIGDGHAVLTVRTDHGDIILDNKSDDLLPWTSAPYRFVKRQSARNAAKWDAIEDTRTPVVGSLR
jgi:predicted transglutaminase-like cysteine proteinase